MGMYSFEDQKPTRIFLETNYTVTPSKFIMSRKINYVNIHKRLQNINITRMRSNISSILPTPRIAYKCCITIYFRHSMDIETLRQVVDEISVQQRAILRRSKRSIAVNQRGRRGAPEDVELVLRMNSGNDSRYSTYLSIFSHRD